MPVKNHLSTPSAALEGTTPGPSAISEQLDRIVSDPLFNNSKRFSTLLRYIVDRTVDGQHDALKERIIGMEVFGRSPDYDTSIDATVRVAATELRKRLHTYYRDPKHNSELRIELPPRSYVAEINRPEQIALNKKRQFRFKRPKANWILAAVALVVLLLLGLGIHRQLTPAAAMDRFWSPVVKSSGPVFIAVGSVPAAVREAPQVTPPRALTPTPSSDVPTMSLFGIAERQPSFPLNDVIAVNSIASFLGLRGKATVTRVAETITPTELRAASLVAIGGLRNDWSMRLSVNLRYQLRHEYGPGVNINWIEDTTKPSSRLWTVDLFAPYRNDEAGMDYAVVSRVLDPDTGQWWVGISGMTGLGTLAAEQAIVNPQLMETVAERLPKGWERRNLQAVFEVKVVRGDPSAIRPVAIYSW